MVIVENQKQLINCIRNIRKIYDCGYYHHSFEMISLYIDIVNIINLLNNGDKEIIINRFVREKTPSEIARVKHCSIANITQRTDKAISRFVLAYQKHYHILLPKSTRGRLYVCDERKGDIG